MIQHSRRRNADKGTALVEFSLAAFTILVLLFGIIDVGRAAYAYDWVSNAARLGTRFMIVRGTNCPNNPVLLPGGCPATAQNLSDYITNASGTGINTSGIDTSQVTVSSECITAAVFAPPPCADKWWVQVKVQYEFRFLSPLVPLSWQMQSISRVVVQN